MIVVTCPECHQSYRIKESKIKGRGAKITCPKPTCQKQFVVYKTKSNDVPDNVTTLDFRTLDLIWKVRKGIGVTYEVHDLATLQSFMQDGKIERWDQISYDNRTWETIDNLGDLEAHFWDIWQKARRGEIDVEREEDEDEDEADAPTTIVGRGSSLAEEIRGALESAATPRPVERSFSADEGFLMEPPVDPGDATENNDPGYVAPPAMLDEGSADEAAVSPPANHMAPAADETPEPGLGVPMVVTVVILIAAAVAMLAAFTGIFG